MTALLATITAILFAGYEAREIKRRIRRGNRRKLNHSALFLARVGVAIVLVITLNLW